MWGLNKSRAAGPTRAHRRAHAVDTLLGRQTEIRGNVHFSGGLHLDGTVKGEVTTEDSDGVLSISETGMVEGDIRVAYVILNGRVRGEVQAARQVVLAATARIDGNVYYRDIEISSGAIVNGRLIYSGGAEETPEQRGLVDEVSPPEPEPKPKADPQPDPQPEPKAAPKAEPIPVSKPPVRSPEQTWQPGRAEFARNSGQTGWPETTPARPGVARAVAQAQGRSVASGVPVRPPAPPDTRAHAVMAGKDGPSAGVQERPERPGTNQGAVAQGQGADSKTLVRPPEQAARAEQAVVADRFGLAGGAGQIGQTGQIGAAGRNQSAAQPRPTGETQTGEAVWPLREGTLWRNGQVGHAEKPDPGPSPDRDADSDSDAKPEPGPRTP